LSKNLANWLLFTALSFIWGSSFILMKFGLESLTAYQVAALRIVSSGLVLLPVAVRHIHHIPRQKLRYIFLSGLLGSLLPAFLFCLAEVGISSALAGTLNALTPIFVIGIGLLFYKARISANKVLGIAIAFIGSLLLLFSRGVEGNQNLLYILFVVLATICYGINVNMVNAHLRQLPSLQIAAVALGLNALPALAVLVATGFFAQPLGSMAMLQAVGASCVLGVLATALASVLFYQLMKSAGPVFSSMVTYGIPVVAIIWGIIYKEEVGWKQVACLALILGGVFVANLEMLMAKRREIGRVTNE
jgi:drug/metabolite transporter (DMT)-like permease